MSINVFAPVVGQYDNIGDIILRRPLIGWLRQAGRLHLYVGAAPADFIAALGVRPEDTIYSSFMRWYIAAWRAASLGNAHYVFKPGEIQLTLLGMREHLSVLPLLFLVRLRRGRVARIGSGARNFAHVPRMLLRPSIALSNLVVWRDQRTADYLGGGVMPDLAFGEGDSVSSDNQLEARRLLVVSMRGDRGEFPDAWFDAIFAFAIRYELEVCVVTQVARDAACSRRLACRLGATLLDWDGTDPGSQELRLRECYRCARVTVSDRLHVLIAAYTNGSVPIALLNYSSDKVQRHFDAASVSRVTVNAAGLSSKQMVDAMDEILGRSELAFRALPGVRERLSQVRADLLNCLTNKKDASIRLGSRI